MSQWICMFVILALMCPLAAATLAGRIVGVHDGDTSTLLTASKQSVRIRLAEIDAPESRQPYGQRAKQALSALAFGRPVGPGGGAGYRPLR